MPSDPQTASHLADDFKAVMADCPWRYTPSTCAATHRECSHENCAVWRAVRCPHDLTPITGNAQ